MADTQPTVFRQMRGIQPIVISHDGRWLAAQNALADVGLTLINVENRHKQSGFVANGCSCAAIFT